MNLLYYGFCFLIMFFVAIPVNGSNFFIESDTSSQDNVINIYLDTKGESINTISGKLIFDPGVIEVTKISDGNSAINFWIEKPKIIEDGKVVFSGIVTGGIVGEKNLIFRLIIKTLAEKESIITFEDLILLKNDGLGTSIVANKKDFTFKPLSYEGARLQPEKDFTKPESFKPIITKDKNIFDGKYFLTFATQDKGSGIYRYEVKEGFWSKFKVVESPHVLKNQFIIGNVYVKAIDNDGNYTVEKSKFDKWTIRYQNNFLFSIILLCISYFIFKKYLWKK